MDSDLHKNATHKFLLFNLSADIRGEAVINTASRSLSVKGAKVSELLMRATDISVTRD